MSSISKVKIDIFVLARISDYLDCTIEDIVEYKQKTTC